MAIIKCKMCGGDLVIQPGQTVGECEYCGTKQTLPRLDDDRRANLYDRASHFRRNNDFDKAMRIYEKILNEDNDSRNAQAYLGKALAAEKCGSVDAFRQKRAQVRREVRSETLQLQPDEAHIDAAVERFSINDYMAKDRIRALYEFDLSYPSDVAERQRQQEEEKEYWAEHRQLSHAEKFATGDVKDELARQKAALFDILANRVQQARAAEADAIQKVQEAYARHLKQADAQAEELRECDYQARIKTLENSDNPYELRRTAEAFDRLGDYRDSKSLAARCRKRAEELEKILEAKREASKRAAEEALKKRQTRDRIITISVAAVCCAVVALLVIISRINTRNRYNGAVALMETAQYEEAIAAFEAMDGYKDSADMIWECSYRSAELRFAEGDIAHAALLFASLDYKDSHTRSMELWETIAVRETIAAGSLHTVGLKADGTVVAVGENDRGQCAVSKWTDIVAIAAGDYHTVGLKADGTVVAVGNNKHGQCNLSEWTDIKLPE